MYRRIGDVKGQVMQVGHGCYFYDEARRRALLIYYQEPVVKGALIWQASGFTGYA
jgi:hypothetical protein